MPKSYHFIIGIPPKFLLSICYVAGTPLGSEEQQKVPAFMQLTSQWGDSQLIGKNIKLEL